MKARIAVLALTAVAAASAHAQTYPTKPVRIIVPYAAGGGTDLLARLVAQELTPRLGQQVLVENRTGASGIIGIEAAARAPADGYTVLFTTSLFTIIPSLYRKLPFDVRNDFVPVSQLSSLPHVLSVHPSLPVKSVRELVALAKSRADALAYASSSSGSTAHLLGEMFNTMVGVKTLHVPYRGAGPALTALISGEVSFAFPPSFLVRPHQQSGRLRALAVTSSRRSSAFADLPTVSEAGLKGFEGIQWHGVLVPAKTPADIVARLHREVVAVIKLPQVADRMKNEGGEPVGSSGSEFARFMASEIEKWARVIQVSGAKAD
ncbi:MAG TPA: tripartite tricarboxylate transporter substrate binding protein [Burkholderiales bacterium]|nr:tripartite tricarboxylate transporter substrate binding protein [Burkholderiales bacterium]